MHAIAAACGFGHQVLVEKLIPNRVGKPPGWSRRERRLHKDQCPSRVQTEAAEQPLLASSEILIREIESSCDREVLGVHRFHQFELITGRGQLARQPSRRPGWMMVQLTGQHSNCQGEIAT